MERPRMPLARARRGRRSVALLAGPVLVAGMLAGMSSAPAGASTTGSLAKTLLKYDILPGLPLLTPSAPNPHRVLHIGIGFAESSAAAQDAYEAALYNPSSPDYHKFLTPTEFATRFGVAWSKVRAVQSWLINGGLKVTETASSGNWVQATGTVGQIEALMKVKMGVYRSKGAGFLANENAPTVPAGDSILTVVGLNTLQRFSTPKTIIGQPNPPTSAGCLPSCDYTPQDLWSLYDQPTEDEGQGMTMAVFGEGRTDDVISNLRAFEHTMKLPEIPIVVHHVGAGPFSDDSGQVEWDLDTQSSTGMAPEVRSETLYFASSLTDADVETAFSSWVSDPSGPLQANASFGECETDPANEVWEAEPPQVGQYIGDGDNLEPVAEATLREATIEGRTLFAAAGDTGSSCPLAALPVVGAGNGLVNQAQPMLNYPCASIYAVCVGGTVLYSNGASHPARQLEYAWPYTGGGSAAFVAEPSWQKAVSAVDHPCVVDPSGSPYPAGTTCRGAPDVAAMSGDVATNAYDFFYNGSESTEGGTSLSSPLWVGMWTRVQAAARKGGLGFADRTFYAIGTGKEAHYGRDFYDITVGTNGLYQAGTGWDYVSGWGVPVVTNLVKDLDGTLKPRDDVGPAPVGAPPKLACGVLWQNGAHVATDALGNSDPQLSLLKGKMSLTRSKKDLVVDLELSNLSATVPTGASGADWYMTWEYKSTTYFAQAQLSALPGSTPSYYDGKVVLTGSEHNYETAHTDTGSFTKGKDGVIRIVVPLANIGKPALHATLAHPAGATYTEEGVPPNPSGESGGLLESVDSGGPTKNYVVGSTCP